VNEAIRSIYARAAAAVRERDRDAFAELFHPEVELWSTITDRVYRGHDGVKAWFDMLTTRLVLAPTITEIEAVDADAWYVSGRLQASMPGGVIADRPITWLVVLNEGLIWRFQPVESRADAEVVAHRVQPGRTPPMPPDQ
jgi:ketosteroid isomerase-like protein